MPQHGRNGNRIDALMLVGEPSHSEGVRFLNGNFKPFSPGHWGCAISSLAVRPILRERFRRAFLGDEVEVQYSGFVPTISSQSEARRRIKSFQRQTPADFLGGGEFHQGDVFVKAGMDLSVWKMQCLVADWEEVLRHAWIPVAIAFATVTAVGWIFVDDVRVAAKLIVVTRKGSGLNELDSKSGSIALGGSSVFVDNLGIIEAWSDGA